MKAIWREKTADGTTSFHWSLWFSSFFSLLLLTLSKKRTANANRIIERSIEFSWTISHYYVQITAMRWFFQNGIEWCLSNEQKMSCNLCESMWFLLSYDGPEIRKRSRRNEWIYRSRSMFECVFEHKWLQITNNLTNEMQFECTMHAVSAIATFRCYCWCSVDVVMFVALLTDATCSLTYTCLCASYYRTCILQIPNFNETIFAVYW